jgi:CubicO group peptidase (beta-lactamase class C family)
MKNKLFILLLLLPFYSKSQTYFPPLTGTSWDTLAPSSLNWCADSIASLYSYLQNKNTKSFIILKDGKIVLEKYFGTYTQDSNWYWASAGKSLTSVLVGIAQENNLLNINNSVSTYLGNGWTIEPTAKEPLITVKNLLSMSSGLNDNVPNWDCTLDTCFEYLVDAGNRWAYHTGAYYKLLDIVDTTSSLTINTYTTLKIKNKIGMQGSWLNGFTGFGKIFYSNARSMARFGLLVSNNCIWNNDTVLHDMSFINSMKNTSQIYNPSYGYLWWLNGKGSFMQPGLQLVTNTNLVPNAPNDMYAAMGKNDQRIYIVPSQKLVVVRQGNEAYASALAISQFDNELWMKINNLTCGNVAVNNSNQLRGVNIFPNPTKNKLTITSNHKHIQLELYSMNGMLIEKIDTIKSTNTIDLTTRSNGIYFLKIKSNEAVRIEKIIKE